MPRAYVPASWAMAVMQGWKPMAAVVLRTISMTSGPVVCSGAFMGDHHQSPRRSMTLCPQTYKDRLMIMSEAAAGILRWHESCHLAFIYAHGSLPESFCKHLNLHRTLPLSAVTGRFDASSSWPKPKPNSESAVRAAAGAISSLTIDILQLAKPSKVSHLPI